MEDNNRVSKVTDTDVSNPAKIVSSRCQLEKNVLTDGMLHVEEEVDSTDTLNCTFCTCTLTDSGQRLSTELADDVCDLLSLSSTEWSKRLLYSRLCLSCYTLTTEARKLRKLLKYIKKKMFKISIQMQRAIRYGSGHITNNVAQNDNLSETMDWSPSGFRAHLSIGLNLAENRENRLVLANSGSADPTPCVSVDDVIKQDNESNEDPTNHLELDTDDITWLQCNENRDDSVIEKQLIPPSTPTIAKPRKQTDTVGVEDFQTEDEDFTFESRSQIEPPNLSMPTASKGGGGGGGQVVNESNLISTLTGVVVFTPNGNWLLKKPKLQLERIDSIPAKLTLKKKRGPYKKKLVSRSVKLPRLEKLKERKKVTSKKSIAKSSKSKVPNEQLPNQEATSLTNDDNFTVGTQYVTECGKLKRVRRTRNGAPIKRYLCPVNTSCTPAPIMSIMEVERHVRNSHGGEFKFFCNISNCSRGFYTKPGLADHTSKKHDDDALRFLCEYCPLRYVTSAALASHCKKIHLNDRSTFTCEVCKKVFNSKVALIGHQAKMHPEVVEEEVENPKIEELKCTECDFISSAKYHLGVHMGRKHPEVVKVTGAVTRLNYVCTAPNCNYATTSAVVLNKHVKGTHGDDRPFKCDLCSKTYKYNFSLKTHKRRDHEMIRVQCPHCPYAATSRAALVIHIKIIHDPKPREQCEDCGAIFPIKEYYKKHKLICAQGYRGTGKKTTAAFIEARRRRERNRYIS